MTPVITMRVLPTVETVVPDMEGTITGAEATTQMPTITRSLNRTLEQMPLP